MACTDPDPSANRAQRQHSTRRSSMQSSVIMFDLCEEEIFASNSLVTTPAFDEFVLTGTDFESIGPSLQELLIHAEGSNFTANFSYRVLLQYRYRNGPWQSGATLPLGLQTSATYLIGAPYTDRTTFGRCIRLLLQTQITAGSTLQQRGGLTISAAARVFSA